MLVLHALTFLHLNVVVCNVRPSVSHIWGTLPVLTRFFSKVFSEVPVQTYTLSVSCTGYKPLQFFTFYYDQLITILLSL